MGLAIAKAGPNIMVRFVISKTLNIELVTQPLQGVARYSPFWCMRSHFWVVVKLHGDLSQVEYSGQISVCIFHADLLRN